MPDLMMVLVAVVAVLVVALLVVGILNIRGMKTLLKRAPSSGARSSVARERRALLLRRSRRVAAGADGTPLTDAVDDPLAHLDVDDLGEDHLEELTLLMAEQRVALDEREAALDQRDLRVSEREAELRDERQNIDHRLAALDHTAAAQTERENRLLRLESSQRAELERVARLTVADAKAEILSRAEHEARLEAVALSRNIEAEARRDGDTKARWIVVNAIQRLATIETTESVVSTVPLPSDEMKGRIIGREGRNIRAFEQITGVNVMVDDTPETVLLSCFDPVRRETARLTLIELVQDGRIHPARIEEVFERKKGTIADTCLRAAEDALAEVGISDLNPGLYPILGSLKYRTSYGQNVLKHLIESAHVAGLMAAELGLNIAVCKRAAFLHDLGKAQTHEVDGSHARVGADLARRYGEHPDIVHAIEAHHNEVEPRTAEAVLTQAADAISGGRPGARRESLEHYVQRLQRLEEIAKTHDGVDRVFAMQAGREIRVMVLPDKVDDLAAHAIAKDIAKQVEEELTYPGQIKVTVVRESRAVELAR
ncbi:MAG: ribonuclease Y [Propionibacteriaceae bacterium]|nr:ribonuclease Y [Micropruina sp.]HBX81162.1 ribonuclease Y [Propionibacteriaceae bacterium]HBY23649.1 ribonuclease Y [Propionibacteriaceae bacterium]